MPDTSKHDQKKERKEPSDANTSVPYISDAMHNETNTEYYDIRGSLIYDPSTTYDVVQRDIPTVPMVEYWAPLFSLNETYMDHIRNLHESCGYADFMETAMTFPPKGPLPTPPHANLQFGTKCSIWGDIANYAAPAVNPCWDVYQIATTCPNLWDVLGFPGSFGYEPAPWIYFNRTDVKEAINAPVGHNWEECSPGVLNTDTSAPSGLSVLPRVIEKNEKTIIAHGMLDFILLVNGTIMMIQNMVRQGRWGEVWGLC
jgi:carboxypeptidase D